MNQPKILFLDIEASDLAADIGHLLTIGYKWNYEKKTKVLSLLDYPGTRINDDRRLLEAFRETFNQADLVVHHFGEYYDEPFLRTRCLINKLKPYNTVTCVDTWRICRKKLKFGSNRLARVSEVLGCPYEKSPVKLSVWADARVGIKSAFKYIIKHNKLDVLVLEWVYNTIKSVWPSHPRLYNSANLVCPVCGGKSKSNGRRMCARLQYQRRVCLKCGHSFKGRKL